MSLLTVACAVMCWPAGHGSRTDAHAAPSFAVEKVTPMSHFPHSRSRVAEGVLIRPMPIGHSFHVAHTPEPVVLNVPAQQGVAHVASELVWSSSSVEQS